MSVANPIERDDRERFVTVGAAQSLFGPFDFKIYDPLDVRVDWRATGGDLWTEIDASVALIGAAPSEFTVTKAGLAEGSQLRIRGQRLHERETDVTRQSVISSAAIEKQLDQITIILQELRRDANLGVAAREAIDSLVLSVPPPQSVGESRLIDKAVTNAKLADMAGGTLKGREQGAGIGPAGDLNDVKIRAILQARGPEIVLSTGEIDPTGVVDCATVINNAAAGANNRKLILPPGNFLMRDKFRHHASRSIIEGQGRATQVDFDIADTTSDLIEVGNGSIAIVQPVFRDILFWSRNFRTGGLALNARLTYGYIQKNVYFGDDTIVTREGENNRLWNWMFLDRSFNAVVDGGQSFARAKHMQFRGNSDGSFGQEAWITGNIHMRFGTTLFHVGGGMGGVYLDRVDSAEADVGLLVDQALQNTINREVFCELDSIIDSCNQVAVRINQTIAGTAQYQFEGWLGSTRGTGPGIDIVSAPDARVKVKGNIYNNRGDGIVYRDPLALLDVQSPTSLDQNGGFGINPTVASDRISIGPGVHFIGNVAGDFNTAMMDRPRHLLNAMVVGHNPATSWTMDHTTGAAFQLAAGATVLLPPGGGRVVLSNDATGDIAEFLVGAGAVYRLGGASAMVAGTPGAGQVGLRYNSGARRYEIMNGFGSTQVIRCNGIRMRGVA